MKIFILVVIVAGLLCGFGVGQALGNTFSILGAAGGVVVTATVLLSLGAFFDYQEKKKPKRDTGLDPLLDRMITGKANPTRKEVEAAKKRMKKASKRD